MSPIKAELEAAEAHAKRELFDAIRQLAEEIGDDETAQVMQAIDDGLALGFADAVVEMWKPGEK